jgi:hypothetical protein
MKTENFKEISTEEKKKILDKFIEKFIKSDYDFENRKKGSRKISWLMWCHYKDKHKCFWTENLFEYLTPTSEPVYFYDDRANKLFLTEFKNVIRFIRSFEPWDEVDAEIFDTDLEWVISVTHNDVSLVFGLDVDIEEYN